MRKLQPRVTINTLLESEQVRRVWRDDRWFYSAVDVVRLLTGSIEPAQYWDDLKQREPALNTLCEPLEFSVQNGVTESMDMVPLDGLLRLVQAVPSPRAERIKQWLAECGRQRLEEIENPELAILRTARLYQQRGRTRQWVDKRLRGVSARHELTSEWRRRGVTESEQYRQLTNDLMRSAFGMDVNEYRRFKNLVRPGENLRDSMSDMELILTMLGETAAVALHRDRQSRGFEQLDADAKAAGEIVARTRQEIESRGGQAIVQPGRYGPPPVPRRKPGQDLAERPTSPEEQPAPHDLPARHER